MKFFARIIWKDGLKLPSKCDRLRQNSKAKNKHESGQRGKRGKNKYINVLGRQRTKRRKLKRVALNFQKNGINEVHVRERTSGWNHRDRKMTNG